MHLPKRSDASTSSLIHVKTGDTVLVLSGKDRGKQGRVLRVDAAKGTATVERVDFSKKRLLGKESRENSRSASTGMSRLLELVNGGTPTTFAHVLLLGFKSFDVVGLLSGVSEGLPFSSYESLKKNLGMTSERMLDVLDLPRRTLLRRKAEGRFSPAESDRLVRLSRVFAKALVLFEGDRKAAVEWLGAPRPALDGVTPFSLIASEVGGREVEALIDRLEHGVFS